MARGFHLDIVLDHGEQWRMLWQPIRWLISGSDWDTSLTSDCYHDSETSLVFLKPACYYDAWLTSNSGIYQKYRKADYTLTTSSKWLETTYGGSANYFLSSSDVNEAVSTTSSVGATNQPMVIAWYIYADGGYSGNEDNSTCLECGWGTPADSQVSLRIYPSGRVQCYRNNVIIGEADITGSSNANKESKTKTGGTGSAVPKAFAVYLLRPICGGLLVTCSQTGKSHHFQFPDIDIDAAQNDTQYLTPNTAFWWWVRNPDGAAANVQADVQLAKLRTATSGYVISQPISLAEAPGQRLRATSTINSTFLNTPTVTLLGDDGITAFNEGTDTVLRVKVTLSDASATYSGRFALWTVQGHWRGIFGQTDGLEEIHLPFDYDEEEDGQIAVQNPSLSVPDEPFGAVGTLTILNPSKIESVQGSDNVRTLSNRPCLWQFGKENYDLPILDGRTGPPSTIEHWNPELEAIELEVRDQGRAFETYRFPSRVLLAGLDFKEALTFIIQATGAFPALYIDLAECPSFNLPSLGIKADANSLSPCIQIGDTAADWIRRLIDDYAPLDILNITPRAGEIIFRYRRLYE